MFGDRFSRAVLASVLAPPAPTLAVILYVANWQEHITSLELLGSNLKIKAITPGCGDAASWLTLDSTTNRLFCMDENGTVSSFQTHDDGSLSRLSIVTTLPGPVSGTLFARGNGLAVTYL